jgi:hypothetical protein
MEWGDGMARADAVRMPKPTWIKREFRHCERSEAI